MAYTAAVITVSDKGFRAKEVTDDRHTVIDGTILCKACAREINYYG